jgi:hypothetical protein
VAGERFLTSPLRDGPSAPGQVVSVSEEICRLSSLATHHGRPGRTEVVT